MKKIILSALALMGVGAMMPAEVSAQFRVVKDGKAILVMEDEVPDYVDFEVGAQEDGHLTLEELMSMTTVRVDKTADGKNGNVLTCSTTAPVSVKWSIPGYFALNSNHFTRKMDVGEYKVILDALCADGTKLKAEYTVKCDVVTNPRKTVEWIYGGPDRPDQKPFSPGAWDAAEMRFSDINGKRFPFLSDEVYFDNMVLVFDISDATDDCEGRVMNGWWSARYDDDQDVKFTNGLWRLNITDAIAYDCARGNGGGGRDLDLMITSGSCTINSVRCEENGIMHDAPTVGEAVDLGLSVKWSSINVGATSPEQAGDYFAWGETKTKKNCTWNTYKYGNSWNINKYTIDDGQSGSIWYDKEYGEFIGDGRTVLGSSDDAASVNWGGDWEMPTINDWMELKNYCSYEWTDNYNNTKISGYIITSKAEGNHNSIFLPAAGFRSYDYLYYEGSGYYWSSSLYEYSSDSGRDLDFGSGAFGPWSSNYRCNGQSVRPVCPSAGYTNGRVAVDLGLPSGKLWATCNVGADAPESYGDYFAWGETESKSYYDWSTYKHMQSGKSDWHYITKYQREDKTQWKTWYDESGEFVGDNKTTLEASDDVATATWGKEWRMPTVEEWKELDENTTKEWTNDYFGTGVSGYILTSTKPGYENAYIFLPAAGRRDDGGLDDEGTRGYYWSSSLSEYYSSSGCYLYFYSGDFDPWYNGRHCGQSVRPVCTK
ncbi:MAG: hypothetical protein MJZ15_01965 [Bacteroidales bacterium]|nr:hypothetical protein [Bacteroidales bacterium]